MYCVRHGLYVVLPVLSVEQGLSDLFPGAEYVRMVVSTDEAWVSARGHSADHSGGGDVTVYALGSVIVMRSQPIPRRAA